MACTWTLLSTSCQRSIWHDSRNKFDRRGHRLVCVRATRSPRAACDERYSTTSWCVVASSMLTISSTSHGGNGSSLGSFEDNGWKRNTIELYNPRASITVKGPLTVREALLCLFLYVVFRTDRRRFCFHVIFDTFKTNKAPFPLEMCRVKYFI